MNGAESLVRTLLDSGIEVCFTNPGTSEMHFVAALDRIPGMRCVLGLFEGVVTGAADGYARMADKPAATLLHCGPGLGNGLANLHNARKAGTGVVNIVGDHATWHVEHDAPLAADVVGIASPVSHWVRLSDSARSVAADGAEAVAAARSYPGQVASLVLPGDTAWDSGEAAAPPAAIAAPPTVDASRIEAARAALINGKRTALILGGRCLREAPLAVAGRIQVASGARLLSLNSNARTSRGRGRVPVQAIPYPVDQALEALADVEQVITVESKAPVAFFAYPDKPSRMLPPDCTVLSLADRSEDGPAALQALAEALSATDEATIALPPLPDKPAAEAALDPEAINTLIAHHLPDNAVLVDEGITAARSLQALTAGAAPHELLQICGGSIGIGPPLALGAAIACPDRKVVALQADGSAMYTIQALWTQAREQLDVVTVLVNNRAYAILQGELKNVGAQSGNAAGEVARDMMRLDRPELNFVDLARGMGVPGTRVHTAGELDDALAAALAGSGPHLIEAMV